ncbi:hypothetical protein ACKZDW_17395 [Ralstonia syzygii subsp. celebesensis]
MAFAVGCLSTHVRGRSAAVRYVIFSRSRLNLVFSIMGRGNYYTWWRKAGEAAEAFFYANGWPRAAPMHWVCKAACESIAAMCICR